MLATVSVLIIVTVSILFMLGYRLDSGNGRLEQGALLQFNSNPTGANVTIDGKTISGQTATKQTVLAGVHSITMTKNGYEDWNRTLSLDAGTLTWLDYIRLVPKERPVQQVVEYTTLVNMQFSPDLKWALAQEVTETPTFQLVDLRSEQVKSSPITIDPAQYSEAATPGVTHQFSIYKWNTGSRYAIIKHGYADKTEWLLLDTQDAAKTTNITRSLNVELTDVQFASSGGQTLYGLTNDGLVRKLDLSGGTLSRALISKVKSFSVYEPSSVVSYIGIDDSEPAKTVAGIYKDGDSAPRVIRTADDPASTLHIATSRYFSEDYVTIAEDDTVTILVGSLPSGTQDSNTLRQFATFKLDATIGALSFSPNGDYVLAQAGTQFGTYELEHKRGAVSTVTVNEGQEATRLKWLDIAHLWNDDQGKLVMRDFDGTNGHDIMTVERGFDASLSQNGRFFYGVGKTSDGRYQLQRILMILS